MFNKILIVADHHVDITDYMTFAQYVSTVFDPLHDVFFSQGPMDVLDHSSSRFSYGSKMGIDVTTKWVEEQYEPVFSSSFPEKQGSGIQSLGGIAGVVNYNLSLIEKEISLIIVGIVKDDRDSVVRITDEILSIVDFYAVKMVVFVDPELNVHDLASVCWYVSGNIDPRRDCQIRTPKYRDELAHLVIDGTRKSEKVDQFQRQWPNPVVSSPETIMRIDQIWDELGVGPFITSPSLKYLPLRKGSGAVSSQ